MNSGTAHHDMAGSFELMVVLLIAALLAVYPLAAILSGCRHKKWPVYRTVLWVLGVLAAAAAVIGPLADRAHGDFTAHMLGHLLLGMFAPLLIVLAAPVTLILRTLHVKWARRLAPILRSRPVQIISNPVTASLLNMGGLWVLYTTDLYSEMHQHILLYGFIHLHIFLAGYLFTASMVYMDPNPHRYSFWYRAIILILALASHSILSKYIYINPPAGVPLEQAEAGGQLMYYGGDLIDAMLIFILCLHWYRAARPKAYRHKPVTT